MSVQGKESLTGVLLTENASWPTGDSEKKSDQVDFGAALAAMLTAMTPQSVAPAPKESFASPKTSDSALLAIDGKSPAYIAASPPSLAGDDSHSAQFVPSVPVANLISPRGKNQPVAAAYRESLETGRQPDNPWTDPLVRPTPLADNPWTDPLVRPRPVADDPWVEIGSTGKDRPSDPIWPANSAPAPAQADKNQIAAAPARKPVADKTASDGAPSLAISRANSPAAGSSAPPGTITAHSADTPTPNRGPNPPQRSSGDADALVRLVPTAAEPAVEIASAGSARLADPIGSANSAPAPAQADKNQTATATARKPVADETASDGAPSVTNSPAAVSSAPPRTITAHLADTTTPNEGSNPPQRSSGDAGSAQPGSSSPGSPKDGSDHPPNVQVASDHASGQPEAQVSQQASANAFLLQPPDLEAADRERATVQRGGKASVDRAATVNSLRGEEPPAAPVQASAPVRPPHEAGSPSEAMRSATLKVELGDGKFTQATVRERSGSVEVRIVAPNQLAEQRISAEIVGLKYALDNAGLRLARAEVSYQSDGRGGRDNADSDRDAQQQQAKKNEIFILNEVNK